MAHHHRVIDVVLIELGDIEGRGPAAKDADVDDAGWHVQYMRAFRIRRGFAVEEILISPMTRGEKLLVVGQAQLSVDRPHAAVKDEAMSAREFIGEPGTVGQPDFQVKRARGRFPQDGIERLGLTAHVAQQIEVIGVVDVDGRIRLEIDDGEIRLGLVDQA